MYEKLINALETAKEMNVGVTVIEHTTPYVGVIEHLVSDRWGHRISLDGATVCINSTDYVELTEKSGGKKFYSITSSVNNNWNVIVII
jgi:hypothetical protein